MALITVFDFDPHNIPSEILNALGLIASCSSRIQKDIVQIGIAAVLEWILKKAPR